MKKSVIKEKFSEIKINSAQIIIGKNGLTEDLLKKIEKKLKKDKMVKIKMLKTAPELKKMGRKEFAKIIAQKMNAYLMEIRGFNLILQKKYN